HALDVPGLVHRPGKDPQPLPVDLGNIPLIQGTEMWIYGHGPQFLGHGDGLQGVLAYEHGDLYDLILGPGRLELVPFKTGYDKVPGIPALLPNVQFHQPIDRDRRAGALEFDVQGHFVVDQVQYLGEFGNLVPPFQANRLDLLQIKVLNVALYITEPLQGLIVEYHQFPTFYLEDIDLDHVDPQIQCLLHRGQGIFRFVAHGPPMPYDQGPVFHHTAAIE